ncbi:MAG: hypothetical protein JXR97_13620, partial [Planctomycetes bacterium]|nr:hypothetical protein [Planctomycetota bacterium]
MKTIDLCGSMWKVNQAGKKKSIPAVVPGCVHTDLLAAKEIGDPFYRDNEEKQFWIGESDWVYTREFSVDAETLT